MDTRNDNSTELSQINYTATFDSDYKEDKKAEEQPVSFRQSALHETRSVLYGSGIYTLLRFGYLALPGSDTLANWAMDNIPEAVRGIAKGVAGCSIINLISYKKHLGEKCLPIAARLIFTTTAAATTVYFASTFIPFVSMDLDPEGLIQKDTAQADIIQAVLKWLDSGSDPDQPLDLHVNTWYDVESIMKIAYVLIQHFMQNQLRSIAIESAGTYVVKQIFDAALRVASPITNPITNCMSSMFGAMRRAVCCKRQAVIEEENDDAAYRHIAINEEATVVRRP